MSIDIQGLVDALASHCSALGHFERVNAHEPKNAPPSGMSAAIWANQIRAVPAQSGLASVSVRVVFSIRLYSSMTQQPEDAIDPAMMRAVDELLAAFSGDFTLGGRVAEIDLLGAYGDQPLGADAGYLNQDGKMLRVFDITVPMVIVDAWTEAP